MNKKKFKVDWSNTMKKIKEQQTPQANNSFKDERIYYPQFNDNGIAQAIIRFLPSKDTDIPFVGVHSHSIKGPGGWYIENCPTTLKKECPACKANSALWDTDPELVRQRKRKLSYYSNILVIKDPLNPSNENKVFLYKYGKKVHDKIMEKIQPGDDSIEQPVMVFDYYDGADFKLIIKKIKVGKNTMPNYDSCQFDSVSCVGTDDEIEKVDAALYNLGDFLSPENFKDYATLEAKFNKVVGTGGSSFQGQPRPSTRPSTEKPDDFKTADESSFEGSDDEFFKALKDGDDD